MKSVFKGFQTFYEIFHSSVTDRPNEGQTHKKNKNKNKKQKTKCDEEANNELFMTIRRTVDKSKND